MVLLWVVVALAVVFAIAAVVVGRETGRLAEEPPRPVFDLDEAVAWVADHLPFEVAAQLSHDDVRQMLRWNLEHFRAQGVSGNGHSATASGEEVVVGDADTVEFVLRRARPLGLEWTASQVHAVLDAQLTYLEAIGALGPAAPDAPAPPPRPDRPGPEATPPG